MEKLTLTEFYDVYGISLLVDKIDEKILLGHLLPIVEKYIDITYVACREELRHLVLDDMDYFSDGIDEWNNWNYTKARKHHKKLLKDMKISIEDNLTFPQMARLFNEGMWDSNYGGKAWGKIAEGGNSLKNSYERKNLKHILAYIDHLNDLKHNNALYLQHFVKFSNLRDRCNFKSQASEANLITGCSQKIIQLWNNSQSIVALYHGE